jgi:hypothetical protein
MDIPVGWHKTVEQLPQTTTFFAWLKTIVLKLKKKFYILTHPGHLTSMK